MANSRLTNFYDMRYAKEGDANFVIPTYPLVKNPRNRMEAAVKTMHSHFKGGRILEVGAGNGAIAASLLNTDLNFSEYVLSDLSAPRVEAAVKTLNDPRFKTSTLDIETEENWPLKKDDKYDAIIMVALIEHLIDPISALQRLSNHVKPGGFIYVMTPNFARWVKRLRLMAGQFPGTSSKDEGFKQFNGKPVDLHDEGHLHYFTFSSLNKLLTQFAHFDHCKKVPYFEGTRCAPKCIENTLAKAWPNMFSELNLIAYK